MSNSIDIDGKTIGDKEPCFIIAEAGVNHNGSLNTALKLIDAAKRSGADAVKFQTFKAELIVTRRAKKAKYQVTATGNTRTHFDMLKALELSDKDHARLIDHARSEDITFLSSPFDTKSADLLEQLGVPAFKTASGEITNLPLIAHIASKNRPLIISTGMSTIEEINDALATAEEAGNHDLALLHCVSDYPAAAQEINLRAIHEMKNEFHIPIGYSDHAMGSAIAISSVAMGARILEKHLTLSRKQSGPDHAASMEPVALQRLITDIRTVESAMGTGNKEPANCEMSTRSIARRSLVANRLIPEGTQLDFRHIGTKRPGSGLAPGMMNEIVGKTAIKRITKGTLISMGMVK